MNLTSCHSSLQGEGSFHTSVIQGLTRNLFCLHEILNQSSGWLSTVQKDMSQRNFSALSQNDNFGQRRDFSLSSGWHAHTTAKFFALTSLQHDWIVIVLPEHYAPCNATDFSLRATVLYYTDLSVLIVTIAKKSKKKMLHLLLPMVYCCPISTRNRVWTKTDGYW